MEDRRPYILFDRLYNKGQKPRKRKNRKTGELQQSWPGEWRGEWKCYITDDKLNPYCWVSADYFAHKINDDCTPIAIGNFDKVGANYPREWHERINDARVYCQRIIDMNERIRELEQKVNEQETTTKTKSRKQATSRGASAEGISLASAEAGEVASL